MKELPKSKLNHFIGGNTAPLPGQPLNTYDLVIITNNSVLNYGNIFDLGVEKAQALIIRAKQNGYPVFVA